MSLDGTNDPRLRRPKLILHMEGAREEEMARGVAAAEAVLYRDGNIDLVAAMAANANREFIMYDDDDQPSTCILSLARCSTALLKVSANMLVSRGRGRDARQRQLIGAEAAYSVTRH